MAISALGSHLEGHHRACSTVPQTPTFTSLRAHRRTHSSAVAPSTAGVHSSEYCGNTEETAELPLEHSGNLERREGKEARKLELRPKGTKSKKKRAFLGVLDAAIAYFADSASHNDTKIGKFKALSPHLALKTQLLALETEHGSLSRTNSTLKTQQSLYTSHISTLTATFQALQLQLDSPALDNVSLPSAGIKEPRRTIDSPQGYSESPYIRPDMYSLHPVSKLPVLLSSVLNFT